MGVNLFTSSPCVTIIEDEPWAQDVLVRAVGSWHYGCQAACTAEQGLRLLQKKLTPIVVTDLRMPGRGGVWLVREVRRRWPEVGVIVLTAGHDADAAQSCLDAGAHHYFLKPIKLDELYHVLQTTWRTVQTRQRELCDRAALEQQARHHARRARRTFLSGIVSLVRTLEERDPCTAGHSLRVHRYAMRLAAEIRLSGRLSRQLELASKLHDIGKVGVPEAVLLKPDALTERETMLVRKHPVIGERILRPFVRQRAVLAGVRGHHERYDGGGYPDGLCGRDIPVLARLIAIPDFYDAVTSHRSYRRALTHAEALELIRDGIGSQFDPEFAHVFLRIAPQAARPR